MEDGTAEMGLAPTAKLAFGSISFAIFWVLAVFPEVSLLPIGRTAGSLLGAVLMVISRVLTPAQAYAAIDLPILGLLFGTMVVGAFLERADMFKYLAKLLSWKSRGGKDLMCRICIVSAISSALFTNDTCCVVLTEFVLKTASHNNLPKQPFLLALASGANIGSSATPIGNPQNLVIAVQSGISFGKFLLGVLPAMLVGVTVNIIILLCYFWKSPLSSSYAAAAAAAAEDDHEKVPELMLAEEGVASPTMFHPNSTVSRELQISSAADTVVILQNRTSTGSEKDIAPVGVESARASSDSKDQLGGEFAEEDGIRNERGMDATTSPGPAGEGVRQSPVLVQKGDSKSGIRWKKLLRKISVYLVTLGMLVALLMGLDMSWTALTAALALIVLDFKDARPCLEKVSYSLLIFFCGMFITVAGFNKTGIPSALWNLVQPYARTDRAAGTAILALVILLLSNVASNVPTVLLLGTRVAASAAKISPAEETKAWLILAWVSTVAGNLSLLGSAANMIVCEQARQADQFHAYNLSFFTHLRFGLPSTLIITGVGLLLIGRY